MNIGYEDDELKPYVEPLRDFADSFRIGTVDQITEQLLWWLTRWSHDAIVRTAVYYFVYIYTISMLVSYAYVKTGH